MVYSFNFHNYLKNSERMVVIRLASELPSFDVEAGSSAIENLVTPGSLITKETGFMR